MFLDAKIRGPSSKPTGLEISGSPIKSEPAPNLQGPGHRGSRLCINGQGAVSAYARCGRCIEHGWTLPWVLAFLHHGAASAADESNLRETGAHKENLADRRASISSWPPKGVLSTELPGCSKGAGGGRDGCLSAHLQHTPASSRSPRPSGEVDGFGSDPPN